VRFVVHFCGIIDNYKPRREAKIPPQLPLTSTPVRQKTTIAPQRIMVFRPLGPNYKHVSLCKYFTNTTIVVFPG
jgi:hypothetical protein